MGSDIRPQGKWAFSFYASFALISLIIMFYYLSKTIIYFTSPTQFPINSFERFPLTFLIFPAEIFSFLFGLYFVYVLFTNYAPKKPASLKNKIKTPIAILLPVYNEPKEIVERTLKACSKMKWEGEINLYLLDDSNNDENRNNTDFLANKYNAKVIRRPDNKGYKAGNINNAIKNHIKETYASVLDADQAPEPEFLKETMDYFSDKSVAFVQTPQHFINDGTPLERAAKIGTNIFYRAQGQSKAFDGAIPLCGTNLVLRTDVLREVGGFSYYTATEDIELGIRINEKGYKGVYVPKILVKGYAPVDFNAYSTQQYRWANGNLAILRNSWLKMLGGNFPLRYKIHMFFTTGWWLVGVVTFIYILVPVMALLFGIGTHHTWLPNFLLIFLFFHAVLGIGLIHASLKDRVDGEKTRITDAFLGYSLIVNSLFIYTKAAFNSLVLKRYVGFVRTNKNKSSSGLGLIKWNLVLGSFCFLLALYALYFGMNSTDMVQLRTYLPVSLWLLFYGMILLSSIIFVGENDE